uniref:VWFA domain-containing protein n=1 Tax=Ciona savignyi TaxID=51511 RepID=H2YN29_CIOSA
MLNFQFGRCTGNDYYVRKHDCSRSFYQSVRVGRDLSSNCSAIYADMRVCMMRVYEFCLNGTMFDSLLRSYGASHEARHNYITLLGDERYWCEEGGLGVPRYIHMGTNCDPVFAHITKDCVSNYRFFFNSRSSARRLCWEYNRAKTCLLRNQFQHCSFPNPSLSQLMEFIVDVTFDYQPYCRFPSTPMTIHQFTEPQRCPPRAHADVIFAVDVSSGTTDAEFISMKSAIGDVAKKLSFGMSGIRIGFAQFHERTKISIRLNRYPNLRSFERGLHRTRRIYTTPRHRRHTGSMLRYLADNIFDFGNNRSLIRPYHTPLLVVMTTGASYDATEDDEVRTLQQRNVHVVRSGPHYPDNADSDVTMRVWDTTNYTAVCPRILHEICAAERSYRMSTSSTPTEATSSNPRTGLDNLSIFLRRVMSAHLPLLWRPKPLIFHHFNLTRDVELGVGTGQNMSDFLFLSESLVEEFTG